MTTAIGAESKDEEREGEAASLAYWVARFGGRVIVYALLLAWTLVALFPLYWTLSTSVKLGRDVTQGHLVPWVDFSPGWKDRVLSPHYAARRAATSTRRVDSCD